MIGKAISHYKILEKIGSGGMGVVYKAEDTKLDRLVALKFLPKQFSINEEEKKRFIHEAKAAAALDHPNICAIHEIDETKQGQMFIVMSYYDGETLNDMVEKGPLRIDKAIDIAIQVAEGLHEAHDKKIVHRDIKSANVIITDKGLAKILDFGLAKLKGQTKLTKVGTTLGTVDYMSPEQIIGEEVDNRTDIWSLGVVLYEMITGKLPFKGQYPQAIIYSIMNEEPEPVTGLRTGLPLELERIINKALVKDPSERYQNVDDLMLDLKILKKEFIQEIVPAGKGLDTKTSKILYRSFIISGIFLFILVIVVGGYFLFKGKTEDKKISGIEISGTRLGNSIAVLPFVDMSPQKDQEYFCDGIAETLINALTNMKDLRVVSRISAFFFKGKELDVREIGKKLDVKTILEGSVQKSVDRIRITAQLINVSDGFQLWSKQFERKLEDVFDIQDEITIAIVEKLKLKFIGEEKPAGVKYHTEDIIAYELYLKGRWFWNKRTEKGMNKAIEYFEAAVEKDPSYAQAYAGLADSYICLAEWCFNPPKEIYPKAKEAVMKALKLDDKLAEAHTALAAVLRDFEWDWPGAEKEYKRAIELNPYYSTAHQWYAEYLAILGRHSEAIAEIKKAHELDPLSLIIPSIYGWIFYSTRQYDQGIKECRKALDLDPNFAAAHLFLSWNLLGKGMYEKAFEELKKIIKLSPGNLLFESYLPQYYFYSGKRAKAQEIVEELKKKSKKMFVLAYNIAVYYSLINQKNQAFKWLNKAFEERSYPLLFLKGDPMLDPLRNDPRFIKLLKKMGFEK